MTIFNPITGQTIFKFRGRRAGRVYLIGRFRNLRSSAIPMRWQDGSWMVKLFLPPGKYEFGFKVNGVIEKTEVAEVQMDYRNLSDAVLRRLALTHTCLCHSHKWN